MNRRDAIVSAGAAVVAVMLPAFPVHAAPEWGKFSAKKKDGTDITVELEDKGGTIPGLSPDGSRYEAYTSWMRIRDTGGLAAINRTRKEFHALGPDRFSDGALDKWRAAQKAAHEIEEYVQVSVIAAEIRGRANVPHFRRAHDLAALDGMGVDCSTLKKVDGPFTRAE